MTTSSDAHAPRGDEPSAADAPPLAARPRAPRVGRGSARAKAILFGEHAVVYGHPAIALPVSSLEATATATPTDDDPVLHSALYHGRLDSAPERLRPVVAAIAAAREAAGAAARAVDVTVESSIPAERGLGSSAAVAAAVSAAVSDACGRALDPTAHHALIQAAERAAHGRPSGLDARAVVAAAPVWFEAGSATPLPVGGPLSFVVADTGVAGRTREAVGGVRALRDARPAAIDGLLARLGTLSSDARDDIASADADRIGAAMTEAHALLGELGVGDPALDALVAAAGRGGALGAKLTGGGRGGCVIALARDRAHAESLSTLLRATGAPAVWATHLEVTP